MELFNIIDHYCFKANMPKSMIANKIKRIKPKFYNFSTGFPPKLWKSPGTSFLSKACVILLCLFLLISCTSFKRIKGKEQPILENSLIAMSEEEIRKKLGEPTVVSLTVENRILWTYVPAWKLIPDNKDTVYVEFENGKVIKIIKAKQ